MKSPDKRRGRRPGAHVKFESTPLLAQVLGFIGLVLLGMAGIIFVLRMT